MNGLLAITTFIVLVLLAFTWRQLRRARRADFIRSCGLPAGLLDKLSRKHPALGPKELQLVARGLRHFFLAYLRSGRRPLAMPSQVADELWHEFILYTRHYEAFCRRAFGAFLHHTPAVMLSSERRSNAGLRRVWWHCCREENINPRTPTRLPLLFALDAKFDIPGGFRYSTDCRSPGLRSAAAGSGEASVGISLCAGDFSSESVDGSLDGLGDGSSGDGSSGGDGGGCSGGGGCGSD